MVDEIFKQRSIQNRAELHFLARDRSADHGENSRANHCTDAERRQADRPKRLLQPFVGLLRIGDQLVDVFGAEDLCTQSAPSLVGEKNSITRRDSAQPPSNARSASS